MSRLLIWFSCGAASVVAAKLAIKELEMFHELVVARCVVKPEDMAQSFPHMQQVAQSAIDKATGGAA